jgi:tetratricopeptide (TPR) repeat protein
MAYRGIGRRADAERELLAGRGADRRFLPDVWSQESRQFVAGLEAAFERAMSLLEAGNLPEAAAELERVNRLHPGDLRTMVNLGVARSRLADFDGALAILGAAIELDPRAALAYVNRASALMAVNRLGEALEDADRAVSVAPNLADAHFVRGGVLAAMGERELGLQEMRVAQRLDPNNPAVRERIRALERQ